MASSIAKLFRRDERKYLKKCVYNLKNTTHLKFSWGLRGYGWARRVITHY